MTTSNLVFIGIKGSVIALNRATEQQVWATQPKGSGLVNVVVQDKPVLASFLRLLYVRLCDLSAFLLRQ